MVIQDILRDFPGIVLSTVEIGLETELKFNNKCDVCFPATVCHFLKKTAVECLLSTVLYVREP
jgi:hypothetical protein